jgi:hypothetical protein
VKTIEKNVTQQKRRQMRQMLLVKYMNKFIKKDLENPEFADHKRFCENCGRETFRWTCCGKRTSRVKIHSSLKYKLQVK